MLEQQCCQTAATTSNVKVATIGSNVWRELRNLPPGGGIIRAVPRGSSEVGWVTPRFAADGVGTWTEFGFINRTDSVVKRESTPGSVRIRWY